MSYTSRMLGVPRLVPPPYLSQLFVNALSPEYAAADVPTSAYAFDIARAISDAAGGVLFFPRATYTIAADFTVPANVTVAFAPGAVLSVAAGKTVTLNGAVLAGLEQHFSGAGTVVLSDNAPRVYPEWWGALGNGTGDDAAAITKANTAATSAGTVLVLSPGRTYRVLTGVTLTCDVEGHGADVTTPSNITALTVQQAGAQASIRCYLPRVFRTAPTKAGDIGVRLLNLDDCEVWIPRVESFEIGVLVIGQGAGCQYNQFHIGILWDNKINLKLDSDATGDANENIFYGGRFVVVGNNVPGTRHILITDVPASIINNNRFIGPSLEGDGPEYHVECAGADNLWLWARWEASPPKIKWSSTNATQNRIEGGYNANGIVETLVGSPLDNQVHAVLGIRGTQRFLGGQRTAIGQVNLPSGVATTLFDLANYGQGRFEVAVWQNGGGGAYSKLGLVVNDNTPLIVRQDGAAAITLTVVGTTIRATQSSGGAVVVRCNLQWSPYD